ncbi:hypothetical protein PHAMO_280067 [Magnetospirillum molischianum DSM 120]|uniref:Uncharacterized protein n=1 Tax=Magnetospirillum molischianum DSM 120 TaxID=1150626 RepID=H8FT45_MAGML|nr:hypothetical protein PHAMO_280067 [Magnetospirillum molischianum DSM 120]
MPSIRSMRSAKGRAASAAVWARRSLEAATIFMAEVILRVDLTLVILSLRSLRLGMNSYTPLRDDFSGAAGACLLSEDRPRDPWVTKRRPAPDRLTDSGAERRGDQAKVLAKATMAAFSFSSVSALICLSAAIEVKISGDFALISASRPASKRPT